MACSIPLCGGLYGPKGRILTPVARFDQIVAFQTASGETVGFHSNNLQVARLDNDAWTALTRPELAPITAREDVVAWNREVDPAVSDAVESKQVHYLSINIAQICNLSCTYCAAGGDGTFGDRVKQIDLTMAYRTLEAFLKRLPNGAAFTLNFLGGEPLLVPDAIEALVHRARLLVAGRNIELAFRVTTNATRVTASTAEMLARHRFHVQVSLDGPREINDVSRPAPGGRSSTSQALAGVEALFAKRSELASISVNAVHGAHNTDAQLSYGFLRGFAWDRISLTFDSGLADPEMSRRFTETLIMVAEEAYRSGGERELRRLHDFNTHFETLDSQKRVRNFCGAGKSQALLDARGSLRACYWWAGRPEDDSIGREGELNAKALARYSDDLVDRHGCGDCWARFVCGGGCMQQNRLAHGNDKKRDEGFCNRTRSLIAKGIELYERARREPAEA